MKKSFKLLMTLAAAAIALIACSKEEEAVPVNTSEDGIQVIINTGSPVTMTMMSGSTPYWCDGDAIGVSNGTSTNSQFNENSIGDGETANTATFSGSVASTGTYYAYYPYTANGVETASGTTGAKVDLPANQNPTATSFDGSADLLVSKSFTVSTTSATTINNLEFARLGAIVKVVLIDGTSVMTGTQHPSTVSMTAASNLAGRVVIDMANQEVAAPYYNQSKTVTATYTNETKYAINGTNGTFFIVYPQTLEEGTTLTIEAATEDYTIEKNITVPVGGIELLPGKVNTLNISLTSSHISAKAASDVYELYTSAITAGDYLIVSEGSAMKASIASNRFEMTAVTISEGKIYDPADNLIWHVEADGEYWTIYNSDADKYAASTGTKNQGALIESVNDNARWTFSYDEEWAIVNKSNAASSVNANIRRNGVSGFATYAANYGTAPVLYKLNDGKSDAEISYARTSDTITEGDPLTPPALSNAHGLTISCSSDNTSVASVNASTGAITVVGGVGTAIITVSWTEQTISTVTYRAGSTTYTLTINSADANDGSLEHPYTVAEALAIIAGYSNKEKSSTQVYVSGIVANVGDYNSTYKSVTYDISDDGTTSSVLNIYSGKNVGNTDFTSNSEISVSDEVVVYGYLYLYNTTSEMFQNNYISSLNGTKYLSAGSLEVSQNNATKQITVTWGAASGSSETISYSVTCGAQNYVASSAGSHTFTMADYGTYTVTVVASASDAASATVSTSVILGGDTEETITSGSFSGSTTSISMTTGSGITISQLKDDGTNVNTTYNSVSTLRVYRANKMSFSGKTFKKIEMYYTGSYSGADWTVSDGGGSVSIDTSNKKVVWENASGASTVTLKNSTASGTNTQLRTTKFYFKYN